MGEMKIIKNILGHKKEMEQNSESNKKAFILMNEKNE